MEIVHSLIKCSIRTCKNDHNDSEVINMGKRAIYIIHNISSMGNFGKLNYIEGVTIDQKILRLKIIQWGGFTTLKYIEKNCRIKTIKNYCDILMIKKAIKGRELQAVIDSTKVHLSKISSSPKSAEVKFNFDMRKNLSLNHRAKNMIISKKEVHFPKYWLIIK